MSSSETYSELEFEIAIGETSTTARKALYSARSKGCLEEKLISVTGASGCRIDLSSFSSVRQVLIENLSTTKYITAEWTDSVSLDVVKSTCGALLTIVIPSPAVGTAAVPLLTLVPETGATCLCRVVVIGGE